MRARATPIGVLARRDAYLKYIARRAGKEFVVWQHIMKHIDS